MSTDEFSNVSDIFVVLGEECFTPCARRPISEDVLLPKCRPTGQQLLSEEFVLSTSAGCSLNQEVGAGASVDFLLVAVGVGTV